MADATQLSLKGMGVDYASNPSAFVVGVSAGSASTGSASYIIQGQAPLPTSGFGAQLVLMGGLNLGRLLPGEDPLDRVVVYANGMSMRPPSGFSFDGRFSNAGVHVQAKVIGLIEATKAVGWGGLDLTAGYETSSYTFGAAEAIPVGDDLGPVEVLWDAVGAFTTSAKSRSVPLEISTNAHALFLSACVGGGLDLNKSSASSFASLAGPVKGELRGREQDLGSGAVTFFDNGTGPTVAGRGFFGLQFDLSIVKLYGHLNLATEESIGGHAGVRVAL